MPCILLSLGERKLEFIAKTFNDIGKAVFVAGLVSNFFPNLPTEHRVVIGVLSFVFMAVSILMYPNEGDKK